jgi:ABC-type transport system substrate-binding protein
MIRLNMSQPPFDNKAVRQALAYTIDRDSIAKPFEKAALDC